MLYKSTYIVIYCSGNVTTLYILPLLYYHITQAPGSKGGAKEL